MAKKLWEKGYEINKEIETFTIGHDREMDLYLAKYDVLGSMAHITMLESIGLLTKDELSQLLSELKNIYRICERGEFKIEEGVEDVHSQVELMLTRQLGDTGKKIHSGRSRNDQVLLDLKLFTRHELKEVVDHVKILFDELIQKSNQYKDVLMPGYTHLQIAMPSSFGLWFGAYAESLADDMFYLLAAYRMVNRNPLGSAAGYGSSFPLNRSMTTRLLGFDSMDYNVIYAQMGRGKMERNVSFSLATVAGTLAKLAYDACLFNCQNFGFIHLPKECTTGSSIMPHKKNPDVFELIRAKSNKIQSLPQQIMMIMNNLPCGYFRDLQMISSLGVKAGIALNPATPADVLIPLLPYANMVLVMTVEPGFGGQKLIETTLPKIVQIRKRNPEIDIQVDGGINIETVKIAGAAGANVMVAGSAVFNSENPKETIKLLKQNAKA